MYSIYRQHKETLSHKDRSALVSNERDYGFVSLESLTVDYRAAEKFASEKIDVKRPSAREEDGTFIRTFFNEEIGNRLKIDRAWVMKLAKFRLGFTLRNEDHINFFGGNLFGVDVVRFTQSDRDYIFEELAGVSEAIIHPKLIKLPTINKRFIVSSDALNNLFIYLVHRVLTTKGIDSKLKTQAATDLLLLMNYRFYTSLMYRYFQFQADEEIAQATYANLSRKFAIKQFGNWNAVFDNRVKEILSDRSIHIDTLETMDSDLAVRYAISDIQGRIRSMCKLLTREHLATVSAKERIVSDSSTMVDHEGEAILKDRTRSLRIYGDYLKNTVLSQSSFIKSQLVDIITKVMPTMPPAQFTTTLQYLVSEANRPGNQVINNLINDVLTHAFGYLYQNRQMVKNTSDLSVIITKLRGTYTSSRNSDPLLLELKETVEELVREATNIKHGGNVSAIRTGVLLYFVSRALTIKYYSS